MKRPRIMLLVIGCSVIVATLFYAFRMSANSAAPLSDIKAQVEAKYPIGTSKSQLLLMLAKDKVEFSAHKDNTVGAIIRDVSGDIVKESIQITFYFDDKKRLSHYGYKLVYTGP